MAHMSDWRQIKNTRNNWIYAPLGGFINAAVVEFISREMMDGRRFGHETFDSDKRMGGTVHQREER